MAISLIWEAADGAVVKGLADCPTQSATAKEMVDSDLNHGALVPGGSTPPQAVSVRTYSWTTNGDPKYKVTGCGLWLEKYYTSGPTYVADSGKTFCDGSGTAAFGNYAEAGGSATESADWTTLLSWGDRTDGLYGVLVSLDRGKSWTKFCSAAGSNVGNALAVKASAMDVGVVDGELQPGDRATLLVKIAAPPDAAAYGVILFCIGMVYSYTE
jgi:hypothetical protein